MSAEHSGLEGDVLDVSKGCDELRKRPVPTSSQLPQAQ